MTSKESLSEDLEIRQNKEKAKMTNMFDLVYLNRESFLSPVSSYNRADECRGIRYMQLYLLPRKLHTRPFAIELALHNESSSLFIKKPKSSTSFPLPTLPKKAIEVENRAQLSCTMKELIFLQKATKCLQKMKW